MTSDPSLPQLDACIGLYLDVWTLFGEQPFEPGEAARRLIENERDIGPATGSNEPEGHLDLLSAYGLLKRIDDSRYRVRCDPDESAERWHQDLRSHTETLHQRVDQLQRHRTDDPHDEGAIADTVPVQHNGETYASTDIDEDATFQEVAAELAASLDQQPEVAGVALRSPAALSGRVQQLADHLCSVEAMADSECPHFEKMDSAVVGEHKDDLEYRLYLRPVR